MTNWFSNLRLNEPFKVVTLISGTLFISSFFIDLKGFTPLEAQLLFGGVLSFSLAWWQMQYSRTHTIKDGITRTNEIYEKKIIKPDLPGIILCLIGLILLGIFLMK